MCTYSCFTSCILSGLWEAHNGELSKRFPTLCTVSISFSLVLFVCSAQFSPTFRYFCASFTVFHRETFAVSFSLWFSFSIFSWILLFRPISWHSFATYRAGIADSLLFRPISWHFLATYRAGITDSLLFRPISWHSFAAYRAGFADSLLSRPISRHSFAAYRAGIADSMLFRPFSRHSFAAYRAGFTDPLLFRPISRHSLATYRAGSVFSLLPALSPGIL